MTKETKKINAQFPSKLGMLFRPARYKIARGGRGSGKSWSFARALLIQGVERPLRVLCTREIQNSIKQSVHKLLKDQIGLMGLEGYYRVLETEIRGINGTEFAFSGLSQLTVDTIKSFEGFDICWVEEGQAVSRRSWKILIPTIRKDLSEIWVSYNPDLETDETHQRFTIHPPSNCVNVEMNWRDNPFFNEVLEKERQHCKTFEPDDYDNIWEGKCRPAVEGAIYYKQIQEAEQQGRIRPVPVDPMLRVHIFMDIGWEDSLSVGLVQKVASEVRIVEYLEAHHTTPDALSAELKTRNYNWGKVWLPHDGYSKTFASGGKSVRDIMAALGWTVARRDESVEDFIEEGIRYAQMAFPQIYFDDSKTNADKPPAANNPKFYTTALHGRLVEALKRYRRRINRETDTAGAPLKDKHAHGADMFRYLCLNADRLDNVAIYGAGKRNIVKPSYQWD